MPRAVVTGAAGFIGSHLVTRLLKAGYEVWMIDNLSTGREENIAAALAEGPGDAKTKFFRIDLADGGQLENRSKDGLSSICDGADYVFHLAALADIVPSIQDPQKYHRSNVDGTVQLLEAVRSTGGNTKVIYAASSSCYGIPDKVPTPETAQIRPQYPYALTKYVAEEYVFHWSRVYGIPAVSLRFFNVYGPRARTSGAYGAVFGVFLAQRLAGKPMTVVGDGSQTRDFVYVTDVAEACLRAAESDISGEVLNVGAGDPKSIRYLCELIGGPKVHLPKRPGEPDCTWADIGKIHRLLDWAPAVSFEEGTMRMLEAIDAWREAPVWTPETIKTATADWFKHLEKPTVQYA